MNDHETDFQISGREPLMWLGSAKRLRRAADLLVPEITEILRQYGHRGARSEEVFLVFPYLMLCGMAVENLLKGILVAGDPGVVEPDRLNLKAWGGGEHPHDLSHLAAKAAVSLSEEELDLLVRMSEAVLWNGRYPIPIKGLQLHKKALLRNGHRSRRAFTTDDPVLFTMLYDRVAEQLREAAASAERRREDELLERLELADE